MEREQIKIEPFTLVHDVLINWWVILLGAIAAAMLTYVVVNERYVPQYSSTATFAVTARGGANAMSNLTSANEMTKTFEKILQSNVMKKLMKEKVGVDITDAKVEAHVIAETNLLVLTVTGDSPKKTIDLIRAVMENYSEVSYYAVGDAVMNVLAEPEIPFYPDNPPNVRGAVKKGALFCALFLIAVFAFLSYIKDTIKIEEDIEEKLDAKSLGKIIYTRKYKTLKEFLEHKKQALLITNPLAEFSFVEDYKKFATKVDYQMMKDDRKVLVVTSVSENEGKSTVAANIALALAAQSKKVLLVEGDLRRPSQFLVFEKNIKEQMEIGEYLKGNLDLKNIFIKSGIPNLYLAIGRNCYSSSTEILHSENMAKLIETSKKIMDYVIIDSPPAGIMGDAEVLADYADAVMVVVKQNCMLAEDINDVLDSFREHHSKVLGVVLNGVRSLPDMPLGDYYGRYGRYGRYGSYNMSRGKYRDE